MRLDWQNLALLSASLGATGTAAEVRSGDAYAYASEQGARWTIGTRLVEVAFECRDGGFRLVSCRNKQTEPPLEYGVPGKALAPLLAGGQAYAETFDTERLWGKPFLGSTATVDPAADGLRVTVRKGDMLGFAEGPHGNYECDQILWPVTVDYGDGESYSSVDDATLDQGPLWFYYVRRPGSGFLALIDSVEPVPNVKEKARIPSQASGFRAPGTTPHIGPAVMHPTNTFEAVRAWKAPRDGTVSVRGAATHLLTGDVDLEVIRIREKAPVEVQAGGDGWLLEEGAAEEVVVGGRPAVQLSLILKRDALRVRVQVVAHPGTPILRLWSEVENTAAQPASVGAADPFSIALLGEGADGFTHAWLVGGNNKVDAGELRTAAVDATYHSAIGGQATLQFVPWTCLVRNDGAGDGWFSSLDYLSTWNLAVDRAEAGPVTVSWEVPELLGKTLQPGERFRTPLVTFGVFRDGLDGMASRIHDWQYEYLWDYTNPDFYCRPMWAVGWFFCSRNLQEQFAARLAGLDMDADRMRALGFEMLWDDAGWSKYPSWPIDNSYAVVFTHSYEGPDFAQTLRYLDHMGMKWLLWFCGNPPRGILDGKVGAWGNYQWRTDGVALPDSTADRAWRDLIEGFRTANPRSSFHTCSGGGTYSHTFEIQRYADVNYLSDLGRGDATNHGFSYVDTPDKWVDIIEVLRDGIRYKPDTSRQLLSMVPFWYVKATEADQALIRRDVDLYHYLLREGVAGRWSYMFHPTVEGDQAMYYLQRTSHDRTKALIVLKHRATGDVTIRPSGLLPEHTYVVGLDSTQAVTTRTGADLMAKGIVIRDQAPGELVYLGLPDRPGSGHDRQPPTAPGRALTRRETNLGHSGIGVYWSSGQDNSWISCYEVRRGDRDLGRTAVGTYHFDHSPGWDAAAEYAVRTVDGDGNTSPWTIAQPLAGEPPSFSALGAHFAERGRDGWSAATSADGQALEPMAWVAPAKDPAGDLGGTPNQPGGVEGYWEGAGAARVGRGWQQASKDADCLRTWTAPVAGRVRVVGRAMKECYRQAMGAPLQVRILHNRRPAWPADGWATVPLNDLVGCTHDIELDVAAGDTIHFVLGRGTSPDDDIVAWMPRIVYADRRPAAAEPPAVVRILCGARQACTDRNGNVWSADRGFTGGREVATQVPIAHTLPTPVDQPLYQHGRAGREFTYSIAVPPGLYALRLKLAEPEFEHYFERPLNLHINGRPVLTNFDVCHAARGARTAYDRVVRHLVPDADGRLVLRFAGGWEPTAPAPEALVQAIEILPEAKPAVRINCGSEAAFVDWHSQTWSADADAEGGQAIRTAAAVTQASPTLYDQALYQTARSGRTVRYRVPLAPGLYTVHLKFAELWLQEPGQRPFDIDVNGARVRTAWDPAAAAGQLGMAADVRVEAITPDKDGIIEVLVTATGTNDAILQAIEIE